jgi:hypothetical protein
MQTLKRKIRLLLLIFGFSHLFNIFLSYLKFMNTFISLAARLLTTTKKYNNNRILLQIVNFYANRKNVMEKIREIFIILQIIFYRK